MIALTLPAQSGGSFTPPSVDSHLTPFFTIGGIEFNKQILLLILSVVIIAWFFVAAARKGKIVPGRLQFIGEMGYNFVRNSVGKDVIGAKDYKRFVPLLFCLFFFILVNNMFGTIPILQMPTFSHVSGAYVLALLVYVVWIGVGVQTNGLRYFKLAVVPSGVPWFILPLVVPIEIISNFVVRPMTHSLRLFATMLAGHLIVLIAGSGIEFLIAQESWLLKGTSLLVLVGAVAMYMLEALIMVLQAYVFVLLTAIYIEGAIHADSH